MSTNRFANDPNIIKKYTNREGDGTGRVTTPQNFGSSPAPAYEVSVGDKPGATSDGRITHTGPNSGIMPGVSTSPNDIQGFVSTTGNKMIIDSTFGSDTITMQHHSGASVVIDSDGSIHLYSTGKKGIGVISPRGDLTIFAKNNLIIKGESRIILESQGDIDFNVGGSLGLHVEGDFITNVVGSIHTSSDGTNITESSKDMSTVAGGDIRVTAAGNLRAQASQKMELDAAKDMNIRTDAKLSVNVQETTTLNSKGNIDVNTKGTHTTKATGNLSVETKAAFSAKSDGTTKVSAKGALSLHTSATTDILGGGAININGSTTTIQTSGSASVDAPGDPAEAAKAQYAPSNVIIDNLTSARVAPDFPRNAKRLSAEKFSLYKNENQSPNPKAEAYAAGNKGSGVPPTFQSSGTAEPTQMGAHDRPAGIPTSNGISEKCGVPLPTSIYNSSQKISKHFTVGHIDGLRAAPPAQHRSILMEAMNTAWNILDPLVDKFGNRFTITSWWRNNSPNHVTGGAVDLRASNKDDVTLTAEIAAFIRDNLPYKQLFLEKNDSPGIHLHVWASPVGSGATGNVMTCADPKCASNVKGLQLSYAVAALKRAGGRVG